MLGTFFLLKFFLHIFFFFKYILFFRIFKKKQFSAFSEFSKMFKKPGFFFGTKNCAFHYLWLLLKTDARNRRPCWVSGKEDPAEWRGKKTMLHFEERRPCWAGKEDYVEHNNFDCLSLLPPSITYTFTRTYHVHVGAPPLGSLDIRTRAC